MPELTIYKASAGSGKTYRLTLDYLRLIFSGDYNYRHILAVTFTNKATAEMKTRILDELYAIATGKNSDFTEILMKENNLNKEEVQKTASSLIIRILHDYSRFSISTIDSFFQQIIRSFIRELGIQDGYSIELEVEYIMNKSIDRLLQTIDKDKQLRDWVIGFIENKINEGDTWNIKKAILSIAQQALKENYQLLDNNYLTKISDKDFLNKLIHSLHQTIRKFEDTLQQLSEEGFALLKKHQLNITDFKGGSRSFMNILHKIQAKQYEINASTEKANNNIDEWCKKGSEEEKAIRACYQDGMALTLERIIKTISEESETYNTAFLINENIYALGILSDVSSEMQAMNRENNSLFLSDSSRFIHEIIKDNETPFIFEKTGSYFHHFMIDEFQDTSVMQWNNFRKLIENSISEGNFNLLVGDVKQSIYRWRNSDWSILAEQVYQDFSSETIKTITLEANYRSCTNIIRFNNTIIKSMALYLQAIINKEISENLPNDKLQNKIIHAYQDCVQTIPSMTDKKEGYVEITFHDSKDSPSPEEKTIEMIEFLQQKGYKPGDIAILVRSNDQGMKIINALLDKKQDSPASAFNYDFISDDCMMLSSSSSINFIVACIKYIHTPGDLINKKFIQTEYSQYISHALQINKLEPVDENSLFDTLMSKENIANLPVYDICENLIRVFQLNAIKEEIPFIESFLDYVVDFSRKMHTDIYSFINWWDDYGYKKSLSINDEQDAIRIMTIHKSKGLQFNTVIIPYCEWNMDGRASLFWTKPDTGSLYDLKLFPVTYKKKLASSSFKKDYFDEKVRHYVDNLNILYVALTRAMQNLIVFSSTKQGKGDCGRRIKEILELNNILPENKDTRLINISSFYQKEKSTFSLGTLESPMKKKDAATSIQDISIKRLPSSSTKHKLRIKRFHEDFFSSDRMQPLNYGKLMHDIFRQIETIDDVKTIVKKMEFEGKIKESETEKIITTITKKIQHPQVSSWFEKGWKIINEREIINPNHSNYRPDRVMIKNQEAIIIDYKFGATKQEKYKQQVAQYKQVIRQMGYQEVRSCLWYVELDEVVEV